MKALLLALAAASAASLPLRENVLPAGRDAAILAAADFNRDGRPDLAVGHPEIGQVTILINDGGGRFHPAAGSPFACGEQPNDFAIADFNRDGNLDLAIVNTQTPFISIFLGDGRGGFHPAPGSPVRTASNPHPHGVAAADFSGHGAIDLKTDSWGRDQIELLTGNGRGEFALGLFFNVGKRPYQRLRTADLNGDGKPDIVTTNLNGDSVTILLGDGYGRFHEAPDSPVATAPAPWSLAVADLNRDGKPDLTIIPYERDAKQRGGESNVTILLGDGTGRFAPLKGSPIAIGECMQPTDITAAELSGGPLPDIAVTCVNSARLALLTPAGGGYNVSYRPMPGKPYGLAAADFFGTGRLSLAMANQADGTVTLLH
jgi:hypothetical protein